MITWRHGAQHQGRRQRRKGESSAAPAANEVIETDITIHVFTVSATLVGACLTVIGIFIMSRRLSHVRSFGEVLIALDAFLFLFACLLSYFALRMRRKGRRHRVERLSEEFFFLALGFMVFICCFIIYELA